MKNVMSGHKNAKLDAMTPEEVRDHMEAHLVSDVDAWHRAFVSSEAYGQKCMTIVRTTARRSLRQKLRELTTIYAEHHAGWLPFFSGTAKIYLDVAMRMETGTELEGVRNDPTPHTHTPQAASCSCPTIPPYPIPSVPLSCCTTRW